MNKIVKEKWLKALRNGEYEQGKNALKPNGTYCCLGVLCELHRLEVKRDDWGELEDNAEGSIYLEMEYELPDEVIEWAGLSSGNPGIDHNEEMDSLAYINDEVADFEEIADFIEEQL